jgi:hypothetical protein
VKNEQYGDLSRYNAGETGSWAGTLTIAIKRENGFPAFFIKSLKQIKQPRPLFPLFRDLTPACGHPSPPGEGKCFVYKFYEDMINVHPIDITNGGNHIYLQKTAPYSMALIFMKENS